MTKIDLSLYSKNGYNYNYIGFLINGRGELEYDVFVTKRQAETYAINHAMPYRIMTFRQAARNYSQFFTY